MNKCIVCGKATKRHCTVVTQRRNFGPGPGLMKEVKRDKIYICSKECQIRDAKKHTWAKMFQIWLIILPITIIVCVVVGIEEGTPILDTLTFCGAMILMETGVLSFLAWLFALTEEAYGK